MPVETLKRDIRHAFEEIDEVIDISGFLGRKNLDAAVREYIYNLKHADKIYEITEMKRHEETRPHYDHSLRVGGLSWMALKYGGEDFIRLVEKESGSKFGEEEMAEYCIGGILHDSGKLKVNKNLLVKSGRLTKEEFAEVEKHREEGIPVARDILKGDGIRTALINSIIYFHHDYPDEEGNGYSKVLDKNKFNGLIQLVALADNIDAPLFRGIYQRRCGPKDLANYLDLISTPKDNTGVIARLRPLVDPEYFKNAEPGRFEPQFAVPFMHMLRNYVRK